MATNQPMDDAEVKATRRHVTNLMRHPIQHHPSATVIHYALDLEVPPLIACEAPGPDLIWSTEPSEVTCPDCMTHEQYPRVQATIRRRLVEPHGGLLQQDITEPPTITANDVLMVAADLLVDANYDYTKAIVDMTSQLIGAGPHDTILMTRILRSLAQGD